MFFITIFVFCFFKNKSKNKLFLLKKKNKGCKGRNKIIKKKLKAKKNYL